MRTETIGRVAPRIAARTLLDADGVGCGEAWVEWETDDGDLMEFMRDEDGNPPDDHDPGRQTGSQLRLYAPLPPDVQAQVALSKANGFNPLTPGWPRVSIHLRVDGTITSTGATRTIRPGASTPSD